jgi:TP901 family phage tail tape measure protein
MPALDLVWNLIARDGASPAFARVGASAEGASRSVGTFLKTMGAIGAGVAVAEAIKSAADFQAKMLLVQTQAGATASEIKKMTPAILSLAGKVAQAPEELATSLYHVKSTGLDVKDSLEAVKIAAEGARVGHADLEQTTNALTATIASGMLPATESYSQAMGQLNTIVGSGDMKMSDLNDALSTGLLVTTKQYGVTLNDVGAALADFGDNNIRGEDAATRLRMAIQAIAAPSVKAAGVLATIGLTVDKLQSDQETGGLNKALSDLHTHLVNSGIDASKWGALLTEAFTKKAGGGIITLIGTFNRFEQKYKEVTGGADSFGAAWVATTKTAAFQFAQLKDTVDVLGIRLGTALLPPLNGLAHLLVTVVTPLSDVVGLFGKLPGPVKEFALALAGVKVASMIGLLGGLRGAVGGVTAAFAAETAAARVTATQQAALWGESTVAAEAAAAAQVSLWGELGVASSAGAAEVEANVSRMAIAQGLATRAMGGLRAAGSGMVGFFGGPWGLAIAGATVGISLLVSWLSKSSEATQQAAQYEKDLTDALVQSNGALDENVRKLAAKAAGDDGLLLAAQRAGVSLPVVTDALLGNKDAYDQVSTALTEYANKHHGVTGNIHAAKAAYDGEGKSALAARDNLGLLSGQQTKAEGDARRLAEASKASGDATGKAGDAAKEASKSLALYGSTAGMTKDEITAAQKAIADQAKQLQQDAASFVDPLKTYQDMAQVMAQKVADSTKSAKDSWSDYVSSVKVDLGQYAANLEKQITDQDQWRQNLVIIAQRAGVDVAQQFADMGVQGAGLTAQMATATGKNFDRMAADMRAKAKAGSDGAAKDLQEGMAVMAAYGASGGKATVQAINTQLGLGLDEVRRIAAEFGLKLTEGLNPFLDAVGHPIIGTPTGNRIAAAFGGNHWSGGYTGDGGKYEPKGVVHGGEFVLTKEQTAKAGVNNLYALASMLSGFSGGGYVSPSDVPHPPSLTPPFHAPVSTAGSATMSREYDAARQILAAFAFAGGNTSIPGGRAAIAAQVQAIAAQRGWGSGAEWAALVSVINHESGFNPNAANPTSSARGLFQKMTSIHGPVESTVMGQTNWGLNYIASAYGDPIGAARHEAQFGWYGNGTNYVPSNQLAFLHKGEAVVPASRNQGAPYKAPAVNVRVFVGNQEIRDITRVEVDHALGDVHDTIHYATGG